MKVYLNKFPRSLAIVQNGFALLLRDIKGNVSKDKDSTVPKCIIEFVSESVLPLSKYIDITPLVSPQHPESVYALLGMISLKGMVFIGFITGRAEVGSIRLGEEIYKITSTMFVCLSSDSYDYILTNEKGKTFEDFSESPVYSIEKLLATGTFYYSPEFDLVSSFQERGFIGNKSYSSLNSLDDYDGRFAWNCNMIKELVSFRNRFGAEERRIFDTGQFLITIIRGFSQTVTVNENEGLLTIISKQDCKKNGQLFGSYCVDDDGNVANFVETELILTTKEYCLAFVQLSGNVPLFWKLESQLLSTKMEFPKSEDASKHAFGKHFETLIQQHGMVHVIDALSKKGNQQELSMHYRNAIETYGKQMSDQMNYTKAESSNAFLAKQNNNYLTSLLEDLSEPLKTYEAFCYDNTTKTYIGRQSGVFLVNTLNSIERANLIQARIAEEVLEYFFKFLKFKPGPEFWSKLSFLWVENGSNLNRMVEGYISKGATTKTGGIVGKVAEQSKKYVSSQSTRSSSKQQQFDKLLGKTKTPSQVELFDPIHDYVISELNNRSNEFTSSKELSIWTGTFNVNAELYEGDLSPWLFPKPETYQSYDIVAVGLEEVVELSPGKMLNIDTSIRIQWEKKIKETLDRFKGDNYTLLRGEQLGGILNLIFVKEDNLESISDIESSVKKTGFKGMSANKGGIAIGFSYSSSCRLCFIASHLAAGFHNVDERHQNYKTIAKGLRFKQNKTIRDYDSVFWLGDFNFRINISNEVIRPMLEQDYHFNYEKPSAEALNNMIDQSNPLNLIPKLDLSKLFESDQLNQQMANGESFPFFDEMEIKFNPTYKFDKGTDNYDTSEKMRVPAWTDRILSLSRSKKMQLTQLEYDSVPEIKFSDHKPVYGIFQAKMDIIEEQKRSVIEKQLYESRKMAIGGVNSLVLTVNLNESYFLAKSGLPAPSGKTTESRWWILNAGSNGGGGGGGSGGKIKIRFPELNSGLYIINPKLPKNPFVPTDEPDFIRLSDSNEDHPTDK
ncbi:hypothetical protein CANARDRAFT_174879 [[Candida] arabinofermentans NRRL YB-2248]|uniref:phosphoinositide 5-phosphatase n=1 Tax=[Candida] arabinofermentans NRRL YB-2248 TaxID=983967 RepID=A0A1E4T4Z9_9ASCO|nr:hypothetical protein CANARDRAFT_174879 [[Candida] arabinofermentans NRRL YB-2248]